MDIVETVDGEIIFFITEAASLDDGHTVWNLNQRVERDGGDAGCGRGIDQTTRSARNIQPADKVFTRPVNGLNRDRLGRDIRAKCNGGRSIDRIGCVSAATTGKRRIDAADFAVKSGGFVECHHELVSANEFPGARCSKGDSGGTQG